MNKLDLRSIMGCPGCMSHKHILFSIYERLSGNFFLKFSKNKVVMGKKIVLPC